VRAEEDVERLDRARDGLGRLDRLLPNVGRAALDVARIVEQFLHVDRVDEAEGDDPALGPVAKLELDGKVALVDLLAVGVRRERKLDGRVGLRAREGLAR
jgi:hypothetical protein